MTMRLPSEAELIEMESCASKLFDYCDARAKEWGRNPRFIATVRSDWNRLLSLIRQVRQSETNTPS